MPPKQNRKAALGPRMALGTTEPGSQRPVLWVRGERRTFQGHPSGGGSGRLVVAQNAGNNSSGLVRILTGEPTPNDVLVWSH